MTWPGKSLTKRQGAGGGCKRFAIGFMTTCALGTSMPARPKVPMKFTRRGLESVGISPRQAITLCRCLNIPARYAAGYLGDIGIPPQPSPMDFSSWFEVYLDHKWYTNEARHNVPRVGRILMVRGRDAVDTALTTSFQPINLVDFRVWTDEVSEV